MTDSTVEAADKLFMTLDPTSRRLRFPREREVVITDTVGLIADLVAAFRTTLKELEDAHLLPHVVAVSGPRLEQKHDAVVKILAELDLAEIPLLVVCNKADLLPEYEVATLCKRFGGISVSAIKREGFADLIHAAEERLGVEERLTKGPALVGAGGKAVDEMGVEIHPYEVN